MKDFNCVDLEEALGSIYTGVDALGFNPGFALGLSPLYYLEKLEIGLKLKIEDQLGDFINPEEGYAHFFDRIERLSRLDNEKFEIYVPKHEISVYGAKVDVPETKVEIEHRRTHHPVASFDASLFENEDGTFYKVKSSEDDLGTIEKLVNIEYISRRVCSVYSEIRSVIELPENWEEVHSKFEEAHREHISPYLEERNSKLKNLNPEKDSALIKKLTEKEKQFLQDHEKIIFEAVKASNIASNQHNEAVKRLLEEYTDIINKRPNLLFFDNVTRLAIDPKSRVINSFNLGYEGKIQDSDMTHGTYKLENPPFNEKFHEDLRGKLSNPPKKLKEYEERGKQILAEAYYLFKDGHNAASLTRAATAFEVVLRGFLIEREVIEKDEEENISHSMRYKMGDLFDQAVRNDKSYKGKATGIFEPMIKEKIIKVRKDSSNGTTFQMIRNVETHYGGNEDTNSAHFNIAKIGISTYNEAIRYIIEEGWKRTGGMRLTSDILTRKSPYLKGRVPNVPDIRADHTSETALDQAIEYMTPLNKKLIKKVLPPHSGAHKKF